MREVIISPTTKFARMRPSALKNSREKELPKRERERCCYRYDHDTIEDISVKDEMF